MNITYVLLSPTFGMHQYTADLANRAERWSAAGGERAGDGGQTANKRAGGHRVRLITTANLPRDRYSPAVQIETPVTTRGTGFAREGLDLAAYRRALAALDPGTPPTRPESAAPSSSAHTSFEIPASRAQIYHFTGVHAWNIPLVYALRRRGAPVIHTLHDLDPHTGVRFPALIRLWNRLIIRSGCHLLVHGRRYRDQLIAQGVPAGRVTHAALLHGFLAADRPWPPPVPDYRSKIADYRFTVIFFGRVEVYKGVDTLLEAWKTGALRALGTGGGPRLVIAGPVARDVTLPPPPPGVEVRDRRIMDEEADALFRGADLLVLPYRDATQSALIAAASAYGLPAMVTDVGALPEYVAAGETGWVVPPGDPAALAAALRAALADPARLKQMGEAARARFVTQRTSEETILANMYESLL